MWCGCVARSGMGLKLPPGCGQGRIGFLGAENRSLKEDIPVRLLGGETRNKGVRLGRWRRVREVPWEVMLVWRCYFSGKKNGNGRGVSEKIFYAQFILPERTHLCGRIDGGTMNVKRIVPEAA